LGGAVGAAALGGGAFGGAVGGATGGGASVLPDEVEEFALDPIEFLADTVKKYKVDGMSEVMFAPSSLPR
jgi:hypothetical protein